MIRFDDEKAPWLDGEPVADGLVWRVEFDHDVAAMVLALARACGCGPRQLIRNIVRDVCVDDLAAHEGTAHDGGLGGDQPPPGATNH